MIESSPIGLISQVNLSEGHQVLPEQFVKGDAQYVGTSPRLNAQPLNRWEILLIKYGLEPGGWIRDCILVIWTNHDSVNGISPHR